MMHFWIFSMILSCLVIILHMSCLFILWRYDKPKNQCFLISVILSEMVFSIIQMAFYSIPSTVHVNVYSALTMGSYCMNIPYCGGLILLTLERYMEVYLHIKYYNSFFYLHRLKFCLGLWLVMVLCYLVAILGMILKFNPPIPRVYDINIICLMAIHAIIVCLFLLVYTYLYKLFRKNRQIKTTKVFTPFFIALTFICFLTIPMVVYVYGFPDTDETWVLVLNRLNSISDGLLYVLFNPKIRGKLFQKYKSSKKRITRRNCDGRKDELSRTASQHTNTSVTEEMDLK